MKNKIISTILCFAMLVASFALCVSAAGETRTSAVFTIENVPENYEFTATEENLSDVTKDFLNTYFDKGDYNAEFYGAYRVSILENDVPVAFTESMNANITLGENYAEKEFFVFYITNSGTASEKVKAVRDGASIKISGSDFSSISNNIIVVMTSNKDAMTGTEYTIVPAVICAAVALVAIVSSVFVIKKKTSRENIID